MNMEVTAQKFKFILITKAFFSHTPPPQNKTKKPEENKNPKPNRYQYNASYCNLKLKCID